MKILYFAWIKTKIGIGPHSGYIPLSKEVKAVAAANAPKLGVDGLPPVAAKKTEHFAPPPPSRAPKMQALRDDPQPASDLRYANERTTTAYPPNDAGIDGTFFISSGERS